MEHPSRLTISRDQFRDWLAFDRLRPIGDRINDVRLGMYFRSKTTDGDLDDFVPVWSAVERELQEQALADEVRELMYG